MKMILGVTVLALAACAPDPVKRQMVGLLEKFDRWDENGDGRLSRLELGEAESISGIPAAEIVTFYDKDKDGRISLREAESGLAREEEARETVRTLQAR